MIQDIYPSKLNNEFLKYEITDEDNLLFFDHDGKILVREEEGTIIFTTGLERQDNQIVYLFSIDEKRYFLSIDSLEYQKEGFSYHSFIEIRDRFSGAEVYAVFTAYHLWKWYTDNVYCGKCGKKLILDEKERALRCPKCGNIIYPRINPAVIVGVKKGDYLLITRYRTGFKHNALIAGFTEIGETLEETVEREAMEEAGVHVKNIQYYKSQPWGIAQDILV